jgi:putative hemolysin
MAITAGMFAWKVYEMNNVSVPAPQTIKIPKKGDIVCTQEAKACPDGSYVSRTGPNCEFALCPNENNISIANPASVFCEESNNAGKLEIRTGEDGGQTGFCKFFDGSECEEWKYFRGECKPGFVGDIIDSNMADLKIYQNKKYGFEFSFPKNMAHEDEFMDGYMISLGLKDSFGPVTVWDTTTYSFDKLKEAAPNADPESIKEKNIILGGNPAIEVSYITPGDDNLGIGHGKNLAALKNNLVYLIKCDNKNDCEKIVSTFKFIN